MTPRTVKADEAMRRGRLVKAEQFADPAVAVDMLADEAADVADAYVTPCVHAGIAAADVVCAARLGEYSRGENHDEAIALLSAVDKNLSGHLRVRC
ncbi:hypothetical protein [Pengzhenrongella frigida]|uniref:hypothetical protein n=1 Tax=Pengzhenrongella frigida TaxID=1259133 RepID=UPI001A92585C|nr:hypothetical protein [Cellulomonas sp. HLT2-17]